VLHSQVDALQFLQGIDFYVRGLREFQQRALLAVPVAHDPFDGAASVAG